MCAISGSFLWSSLVYIVKYEITCGVLRENMTLLFTAALALRSRGLVIGSREKEEEKEREREEKEEEKNLQIAIRCLWDLFD